MNYQIYIIALQLLVQDFVVVQMRGEQKKNRKYNWQNGMLIQKLKSHKTIQKVLRTHVDFYYHTQVTSTLISLFFLSPCFHPPSVTLPINVTEKQILLITC